MKRVMVAAALLLSVGSAHADEKPPALPADLAWIPQDCAALVHVRFGDLWNTNAGKILRDMLAKSDPSFGAGIEEFLGVNLAQIDRLTILLPSLFEATPFEDNLVIRVKTIDNYDKRKVLAAMSREEGRLRSTDPDQSLFALRRGYGFLHLDGGKNITLILGQKAEFGLLNKMLSSESSATSSQFAQLAGENHHLSAAANLTRTSNLFRGGDSPFDRRVLSARQAILKGDLKADAAEFEMRLTYPRKTFAEQGVEALRALEPKFDKLLAPIIDELKGDTETAGRAAILTAVWVGLRNARIEQMDSQVTVRIRFETKAALEIFAREGISVFSAVSRRKASQNNLKHLALAMHNYASARGPLPPAAICDKNGKPLLSWRVEILPYMDEDKLYRQFHLDESWDSEHNKKLLKFMPKVFALPGDKAKHDLPSTYYRVFVGNGAIFNWTKSVTLEQLTAADGASGTLLITEAADVVPWTKPEELEYDPKKPPKFGFLIGDRCNFVFGDGSAGTLKKNVKEQLLRSLIQWRDGQSVGQADLDK